MPTAEPTQARMKPSLLVKESRFFISFSFINDKCLCSIPFFSGEGQNKTENCTESDDFFEEQRADSLGKVGEKNGLI